MLMAKICFLPKPYKEDEGILICRVTEKEIEEAFLEIIQIKIQLKR